MIAWLKPPRGIESRNLHDQRPVRIACGGGIHFDEVRSRGFHRDCGLGSGQGQRRLELDGNGAADADILPEHGKARCRHFQVVRIRRNIAEPERALGAGDGGLPIAGDGIVDGDRGLGDGGAGRVDHTSFDGARVSQRLAEHRVNSDGTKHEQRTKSENFLHVVQYWDLEDGCRQLYFTTGRGRAVSGLETAS